MNADKLLEEYAAVAAERALRITELAQERDALASANAALPSTSDSARVRELEAQVAQLRKRVRRAEATVTKIKGIPLIRVALRLRAIGRDAARRSRG